MKSSQTSSQTASAPTTPTKSAAKHRQKDILTTPKSAKNQALQKTLCTGPNYVRPANFDDETTFNEKSVLMGQTVQVGNSFFTYGKNLAEYKDSTDLYRTGNRSALLERLDNDGYILIRRAIGYETALAGREKMIDHLSKKDAFDLKKGPKSQAYIKHTSEDGWTVDAETGGFVHDRESDEAIDGWREIGWCPEVRNVYNGPDLHAVYSFLWGQPRSAAEDGYVALSQNTWLRAKAKGEVTSEHADYYYFKENTTTFQENRHPYVEKAAEMWNEENPLEGVPVCDQIECDLCLRLFDAKIQVPRATGWDKETKGEWHCQDCASQFTPFYTCWIALGEYKDENSTLAMMPKTQSLKEFGKPLKTNLLPEDYNDLVKQKWGWLRTNFGLGDIVIFNWKTVHGASKNTMEQFRFSFDTRVSASWFRPKALFGDKGYRLEYQYPDAKEKAGNEQEGQKIQKIQKNDHNQSGAVYSQQFLPQISNPQCPSKLSLQFLQERAAAEKAGAGSGQKTKKKVAAMGMGMGSGPKVMGMGMGGGMGAKASKKPAAMGGSQQCLSDDGENDGDADNDDENDKNAQNRTQNYSQNHSQNQNLAVKPARAKRTTTLSRSSSASIEPTSLDSDTDTDTEAQRSSRARAARILARGKRNGKLGADGVGRWGNDDEESDFSQSSQPSTPSRRQQRILRERSAVELAEDDKFQLEEIEEGDETKEEEVDAQVDQAQVEADDAHKKARVRKADQLEVLGSDDEEGKGAARLVKRTKR